VLEIDHEIECALATGIPWTLPVRQRETGGNNVLVHINLCGSCIPETICTGWNHRRNDQCQSKGRTSRPAGWGTSLWGALWFHWNNREHGASTLRFSQAEKFYQKCSAIWAHNLKSACYPCPRPKMFLKYIGFKECKIISLHGAPNYWTAWGALTFGVTIGKPVSERWFRLKCIWQASTPQQQMQPCMLMRFYMDTHHVTVFLTPC